MIEIASACMGIYQIRNVTGRQTTSVYLRLTRGNLRNVCKWRAPLSRALHVNLLVLLLDKIAQTCYLIVPFRKTSDKSRSIQQWQHSPPPTSRRLDIASKNADSTRNEIGCCNENFCIHPIRSLLHKNAPDWWFRGESVLNDENWFH